MQTDLLEIIRPQKPMPFISSHIFFRNIQAEKYFKINSQMQSSFYTYSHTEHGFCFITGKILKEFLFADFLLLLFFKDGKWSQAKKALWPSDLNQS